MQYVARSTKVISTEIICWTCICVRYSMLRILSMLPCRAEQPGLLLMHVAAIAVSASVADGPALLHWLGSKPPAAPPSEQRVAFGADSMSAEKAHGAR